MSEEKTFLTEDSELLSKALSREKKARQQAEEILEQKSRELFEAKEKAENQYKLLEQQKWEVELLLEVSKLLQNESSFEKIMQGFVNAVCKMSAWPIGHVYVPVKDEPNCLTSLKVWYLGEGESYAKFKKMSEMSVFTIGIGLPGRVLKTGQPVWIENILEDKNFPFAKIAKDIFVKSAFAFPIRIFDQVVAVCEFFCSMFTAKNERWLSIVEAAASHLGSALESRRSEIELRENYAKLESTLKELNEAQVQLVQSEKLASVGQLAAGIAHEINTPIQYVGDNIRFVQDSFKTIETLFTKIAAMKSESLEHSFKESDLDYLLTEIPQALSQSLEGVSRVSKIVQAMKEFSHPSGQKKQTVDINRSLETTLTVAHNEWKYVADTELHLDPNLPLVACYPDEMNQVFLNLIVNAAHTIQEKNEGSGNKGMIRLSTQSDNDFVIIHISDTGKGIPENIQHKIFDPFFTTKEVGRGTGQGLAISRSVIVDKHGGQITFQSTLGEGTKFIIKLPRA